MFYNEMAERRKPIGRVNVQHDTPVRESRFSNLKSGHTDKITVTGCFKCYGLRKTDENLE